MPEDIPFNVQLEAEFKRLGLDPRTMPGGTLPGGIEGFIPHLQALKPGATWRDVFPDIPSHWELDKPETWTQPYTPLGPYDYQELPTGAAIHIEWREGGPQRLPALLEAGRAAGWLIYGAGWMPHVRADEIPRLWGGRHHAFVILERGAPANNLPGFLAWLDQLPDVEVATVPRMGTERYYNPGEAAT